MTVSGVLPRVRGEVGLMTTISRLIVAWQHPQTRTVHPVGLLEALHERFRFRYIARARSIAGFRPLAGFPELDHSYESDWLFPLFAERVMDPRRPDYSRYLVTLDLPEDAAPMELLARSGGHRIGDTIQLVPEPLIDDGGVTSCRFLVHGVRHTIADDPTAERRMTSLRAGDALLLEDEPSNPYNPRAILVTETGRERLGWVPDLLVDYVHAVRGEEPVQVRIEHVNGSDAPPHLRLLARLDGRAPVGYRPFSGPEWLPLS